MAKELSYTTKPAPRPTARDELEELIKTLSSSGALRALNGFVGQFDKVSGVALQEANTPTGRNILGSLILLADCLARVPASKLKGLSKGLELGLDRAETFLEEDPPSTFQLMRMARDEDVRRALGGILTILGSVGASLAEAQREEQDQGEM